jgi:radical SAM superfamily enzyme YgiQ (UPF0313 family)
MTSKKILFTIPKVKSMYGDDKSKPLYPHVGIAYLAAILKKAKYQVQIFDHGVENNLFQIIDNFNPDIIGVTGYSYASLYLEKLIEDIRKHTSTPIIVGGPHVSAVGKNILITTKADFAMVSESELSLPLFLKQFFSPKPKYSTVPNLIWHQNNQIIQNPTAEYLFDLDKLPFPDFTAFKFYLYPCYAEKKIPILTSRGCPYNCSYCSVRLSMGQCFRPRSAQNVFQEINYWYQQGFNKIDINDDCFTLDLKRAENICDLIIKHQLKLQIQLYNGIRVDRITPRLLTKLKKAGCIFIAYGCESGSQKIINSIGKNIKLRQVRRAVDWTNTAGIKNAVNFIVGHPGETFSDAKKTLEFAKSVPTNFVNFYNLVPYPGTPAYNWAVTHGRFLHSPQTYLQTISYRDNTPIFDTPKFTFSQRQQIMKIGFDLYEKKLFQFRLGPKVGLVAFILTRVKVISRLAHWLLVNNYLFRSLVEKITTKSKT